MALFSSCLPGWRAEDVLATATALGVDAVEWGYGPAESIRDVADGARIAALCKAAGVRTIGVSVQDPALPLTGRSRQLDAVLELARTLGAGQLRLFAEPYRGGRVASERRRHVRALDRLVQRAAPAGVKVLVETSPGTLAAGPSLALALVSHQPPSAAGVLYDPGNMIIEGNLAPALTVALLGRHLAHVHVKNIAWSRRGGEWRWRYAPLGAGLVRWPEVVGALAAAGYRGRCSLDHLPGRQTAAVLERESAALAQLLAQGGF